VSSKCRFVVKPTKRDQGKSPEVVNSILIKRFVRMWKQSGIAQELKEKSAPRTRGMKKRKKIHNGKMRHLRGKKR